MRQIFNGFITESDGTQRLANAHLSYKGRSVIIDYEWILHAYHHDWVAQEDKFVPVEMYPWCDGITIVWCPTIAKWSGKADLSELIKLLDKEIEDENKL